LERILIKNRLDAPYVLLDANEGYGEITGKSYPPDVSIVYDPLITWFDYFNKSTKLKFELILKLDYINTASIKLLMDLLYKMEEGLAVNKILSIKWFYPEDDDEMVELGLDFEKLIKIPFQHIAYTKKF